MIKKRRIVKSDADARDCAPSDPQRFGGAEAESVAVQRSVSVSERVLRTERVTSN